MKQQTQRPLAFAFAIVASVASTSPVHAGPWLDSLLGINRNPAYPAGAPVPVSAGYSPYGQYAAGYNGYPVTAGYSSYYGAYPSTANAPLLPPGIPQTVAGQLPTAAYDTQWAKTPVTYYRPVTTFDPRYGTNVTSLQPCASYQYQAQRVPVIAPRPLLGDYGYQANRWPGINAPGYNPMGLTNTAAYMPQVAPSPVYTYPQPYNSVPVPSVQRIPANGLPMANSYSSGATSGLPTSSMPLTTMNYGNYSAGGMLPTAGTVVPTAAWMPSNSVAVPSGAVPYATAYNPATVYNPNCPNGNCGVVTAGGVGTTAMQPPVIPGASSVIPIGPPTISATPNPGINPGLNNYAPSVNGLPNSATLSGGIYPSNPSSSGIVPGASLPSTNQGSSGIYPPNYMPGNGLVPSTGVPLADPESTRQPSVGQLGIPSTLPSNPAAPSTGVPASTNNPFPDSAGTSTAFNLKRLPMTPVEHKPETDKAIVQQPTGGSNAKDGLNVANSSSITSQAARPEVRSPLPIPSTLPASGSVGVQPLLPPDDIDASPRWNPQLLEPRDKTATGLSVPSTLPNNAPASSAPGALTTVSAPKKSVDANLVRWVNNSASSNNRDSVSSAANNGIRFRPVTQPK